MKRVVLLTTLVIFLSACGPEPVATPPDTAALTEQYDVGYKAGAASVKCPEVKAVEKAAKKVKKAVKKAAKKVAKKVEKAAKSVEKAVAVENPVSTSVSKSLAKSPAPAAKPADVAKPAVAPAPRVKEEWELCLDRGGNWRNKQCEYQSPFSTR